MASRVKFCGERDRLGPVREPADAPWGAKTQRAVDHFGRSDRAMLRGFLYALGLIKATRRSSGSTCCRPARGPPASGDPASGADGLRARGWQHATLAVAAQSGQFQLTTMRPPAAGMLLDSIGLPSRAARALADKAIARASR